MTFQSQPHGQNSAFRADASEDERRIEAVECGFTGDEARARRMAHDSSPKVRAAALGALRRLDALSSTEVASAAADPSSLVRRTLCELVPAGSGQTLLAMLDDPDARVVEAAAFALGELEWPRATVRLCSLAAHHTDPLCREAAVASLGAIGDPRAKDVLLAALQDVAAIRRRAVIALSRYDGPDVHEAIRARLEDRDWQVRQAAEELRAFNDSEGQ